MKKLTINLLALSLLSLATFTFSNDVLAQEQGKITAQASEFKYVAPDTATITFTIETEDKNSQKAVEINNQKVTKLIDAIKKELAENETVKTSAYSLNQRYEYNNVTRKNVLVGYAVSNSITVQLKDTQKTGKIIDVASKNNVTNISGLSFSLQNTNAVCKELTQKAVIKAKNEANNVLAPLGKTVDAIANINYSCSTQMRYSPYRNFVMKSAGNMEATTDSAVSIEEGETRVDASVTIVFTIK